MHNQINYNVVTHANNTCTAYWKLCQENL